MDETGFSRVKMQSLSFSVDSFIGESPGWLLLRMNIESSADFPAASLVFNFRLQGNVMDIFMLQRMPQS